MNNEEIIQTIDLTPTWSMLLPAMLNVYEQAVRKRGTGKRLNPRNDETIKAMRKEIEKMALGADKWIEHCKKLKEESIWSSKN